jgi:quinol-cytochrome oxidoreductase complex cytochrome b subunit
LGVIGLALSIFFMLILPLLVGKWMLIRSIFFRPFFKVIIVIFVINSVILGWVGGQPVVAPFYEIGQVSTFVYFFLFVVIVIFSIFENMIIKYYVFK